MRYAIKNNPVFVLFTGFVLVALSGYYSIDLIVENEESRFFTQLWMSRILFLSILILCFLYVWRNRQLFQLFLTRYDYPLNLALFRILLFGFCIVFVLVAPESFTVLYEPWLNMPESARNGLPPFGDIYAILPLNHGAVYVMIVIWYGSLIGAFLGIFTGTSVALWTISTFYIFGIPQYFGKVGHYHFLIWFSMILMVSPCGDRLSIDALIQNWKARKKRVALSSLTRPAFSYSLPLGFVLVLLGVAYFFPGFWKLWHNGLDWALTDNMKYQMQHKWMDFADWEPIFYVTEYPLLYRSGGLLTILFELFFWFFIVFPKGRIVAFITGILFHVTVYLFMHINFLPILTAYMCLINVSYLFYKEPTNLPKPLSFHQLLIGKKWIMIVGVLLIVPNMIFGALKITDGWPYACFPTFDSLKEPVKKRLSYYTGSSYPTKVQKQQLKNYFRPSRYKAMEQKIIYLYERDELGKENPYLKGIVDYIQDNVQSDTLHIYMQKVIIKPNNKDSIVQSESVLSYELQ